MYMPLRLLALAAIAAVAIPLAPPARAADDPALVRSLLERVVDGGQGTLGDAKHAQIVVGAVPPGAVLPPLPPDARVVGSVVRETSGTVVYLDVPRTPAEVRDALEKAYTAAGYAKSTLPGQGGFSTATAGSPSFFCKGDDAVSFQANGDASPPLAHVNVSLLHGGLAKTLCGGANGFAALTASLVSTIPSLRPSDGMTIDGSTTGVNTGAGAFLGGARPSTAWGHIASTMTLPAVTTALATQLTAAGWTTTASAVIAGGTAYERFTTPATATAAAGDALLTVTKGPANTYDAFIRAIVPAEGSSR
jgi:hypothetical protein